MKKTVLKFQFNTPPNIGILKDFFAFIKSEGIQLGLYVTRIRVIESHNVNISKLNNPYDKKKVNNPKLFILWHERLGILVYSMMLRIIENSIGHPLKNIKVISGDELPFSACSSGN